MLSLSMTESFAILGREPELSVAELEAVFGTAAVTVVNNEVALVRCPDDQPAVIDRLGGTVKLGRIVYRTPLEGDPIPVMAATLNAGRVKPWLEPQMRDVGGSLYGGSVRLRGWLRKQMLELKKQLKASGRVVRIVASREPQLSSVTVRRQGLLTHGREIVLILTATELIVGLTEAVQDYQAYAVRDRGRPAADPKRGMLPPKLAQMMLNIARVRPIDVLLDPFCGVGTILQEAALLGVRQLHGSDFDPAAVQATQENMRWLVKEFPTLAVDVEVTRHDARQVTVRPSVIVTEPDLGVPQHGHEPISFVSREAARLEKLYLESLARWHSLLIPGGRVMLLVPAFQTKDGEVRIDISDSVERLGFTAQTLVSMPAAKLLELKDTTHLEYGRDDARVRRVLHLWEKAG